MLEEIYSNDECLTYGASMALGREYLPVAI